MKEQLNDFTTKSLPHNRRQVYKDILKNRMSLLINLGLIILAFSIPLIIVNVMYNILSSNFSRLELSDEEMYLQLLTILNLKNLLYIPGLLFLGFGLSGVYQIIRQLVWGNNVMIKMDFKKGLKTNSLPFLISFFIIGILNFVLQYLLFSKEDWTKTAYIIALGIIIAAIVILTPALLCILNHTTIYNLGYGARLKNGLLITALKFYILIPLGLLNLSFIFIQYIPSDISYYLSIVLLPLLSPFLITFNMLVYDIFFDQFINKDNYPEIYRKGMVNDNE